MYLLRMTMAKRERNDEKGVAVALLLYGQPRCIDKGIAFASHKKLLLEKYATDVFCHMWEERNAEQYETSPWSVKAQTVPAAKQFALAMYEPVAFEYSLAAKFDPCDELKKLVDSENFRRVWKVSPNALSNCISQLFSIEQVAKLLEKHMSTQKMDYEWAIVTRYDITLDGLPDLTQLDRTCFYLMNNHPRFPDLVFIFDPKVYLQSQFTYSNLAKTVPLFQAGSYPFFEPNAESLKNMQYLASGFKQEKLCPIPLRPHRVISTEPFIKREY